MANCYQQRGGNGKKGRVDGKRLVAAMEDAFPLTDRELLQQARRKGGGKDGTTVMCLCTVCDTCAARRALSFFASRCDSNSCLRLFSSKDTHTHILNL